MNKNNKKTMNERTHNSFDIYKNNKNSNSNNNNPNENLNEEFAADFVTPAKNKGTNKRK